MNNNHAGMALAMAAGLLVFAVAPPAILPIASPDTTPGHTLPHNQVALYLTYGGSGTSSLRSRTQSAMVELRRGHFQGSLRWEEYPSIDHLQFATLNAGYVWHVKRVLIGGIQAGYRRTGNRRSEDAALLSLPLTTGAQMAAMRLEPTYVISAHGVHWTYRIHAEFYPSATPLIVGAQYEYKPLHQGGRYRHTFGLLLGLRR